LLPHKTRKAVKKFGQKMRDFLNGLGLDLGDEDARDGLIRLILNNSYIPLQRLTDLTRDSLAKSQAGDTQLAALLAAITTYHSSDCNRFLRVFERLVQGLPLLPELFPRALTLGRIIVTGEKSE
jgi:hypothetical protein